MPKRVTVLLLLLVAVGVGASAPPSRAAEEDPARPAPCVTADDLAVEVLETTCNTYLVQCRRTGAFVLVDPGPGSWAWSRARTAAGGRLAAVWITHGHPDHVAGLGEIAANAKVPVVAHAEAAGALATLRARWKERRLDALAPVPPVVPDTRVGDGAEVRVGDLSVKVLHVPGHSRGSIAFRLDDRLLLVGDVLFAGSVGRTDLEGADHRRFQRSLSERLWDLPGGVAVLPGHGARTTIGTEKATNALFQDYVREARGESPLERPWMGVEIDAAHAGPGVRLGAVAQGSPAARAGLVAGDVLRSVGEDAITSPRDLAAAIRRRRVGEKVAVTVLRDGEVRSLELTLGARPPP